MQGIRGLSPLDASLLLIPGYVAGSFLGPIMGRLADKYGSREIASLGVFFLALAIAVYLTMSTTSPLYIVLIASAISGLGTSMFFPANNSAVMASAPAQSYGVVSGLLRTLSNIGMVCSFAVALLIASLSIPRQMAFEIFLGVGRIQGQLSSAFVDGMHVALAGSISVLLVALVLSVLRGKEARTVKPTASA